MNAAGINFDSLVLVDEEVPFIEACGEEDGPVLTLLAGVHGCEYTAMRALTRFMRSLDVAGLRGHIRALPVVDVRAFRARKAFVSPVDGENLNRCFPGSPSGGYSERLADAVFRRFIIGSDAVVDLHSGDLHEALTPYALYDDSPVAGRSKALAEAYGTGLVIAQASENAAVTGSTSSAAAAAGVPAVIAEAGGCGVVDAHSVEVHLTGLRRVLDHLGMTSAGLGQPKPVSRHASSFVWLRTDHGGWWEPAVVAGEEVRAGALLGRLLDLLGNERATVVAPVGGVCAFVTVSPAVADGGLLLAIARTEPAGPANVTGDRR